MTTSLGIASDGLLDRGSLQSLHIAVRGLLQSAADGVREIVRNVVEAVVARSIVVLDRPETALATVMATTSLDLARSIEAGASRLAEAFVCRSMSAEITKATDAGLSRKINADARRAISVRRR